MNTMLLRKSVLGVAGLAFAAGVAGGPLAHAATTEPVKPVAMTVTTDHDDRGGDRHKPAGVDRARLMPHGAPTGQSRIDLDAEQTATARAIIAATKKAGMDERAAVVSVATSLQESKLENLGHLGDRNDHDSLGLFQQRPSSGWGSPDQITDPAYSTTEFLKGLKQVDGWHDMPLTQAAQAVQVSAYPDAYAKWEQQAADLVAQYWNS